MVSKTKPKHCIPKTATLTPVSAISYLLKFGLYPEKREKI